MVYIKTKNNLALISNFAKTQIMSNFLKIGVFLFFIGELSQYYQALIEILDSHLQFAVIRKLQQAIASCIQESALL